MSGQHSSPQSVNCHTSTMSHFSARGAACWGAAFLIALRIWHSTSALRQLHASASPLYPLPENANGSVWETL